jgi:hypothetical protein
MESIKKPKIAIAYGVTGGRHPQMLGAAVAMVEAMSLWYLDNTSKA